MQVLPRVHQRPSICRLCATTFKLRGHTPTRIGRSTNLPWHVVHTLLASLRRASTDSTIAQCHSDRLWTSTRLLDHPPHCTLCAWAMWAHVHTGVVTNARRYCGCRSSCTGDLGPPACSSAAVIESPFVGRPSALSVKATGGVAMSPSYAKTMAHCTENIVRSSNEMASY